MLSPTQSAFDPWGCPFNSSKWSSPPLEYISVTWGQVERMRTRQYHNATLHLWPALQNTLYTVCDRQFPVKTGDYSVQGSSLEVFFFFFALFFWGGGLPPIKFFLDYLKNTILGVFYLSDCIKIYFGGPQIPNSSWGACPQTPLDNTLYSFPPKLKTLDSHAQSAISLREMQFIDCSYTHTMLTTM